MLWSEQLISWVLTDCTTSTLSRVITTSNRFPVCPRVGEVTNWCKLRSDSRQTSRGSRETEVGPGQFRSPQTTYCPCKEATQSKRLDSSSKKGAVACGGGR